jgi:hypothetical protein
VPDSSEGAGALRYPLFLETLLGLPLGAEEGRKSEEGRLEIPLPFWRVNVAAQTPAGLSVTGESLNKLLGTPLGVISDPPARPA